MSRQTPVHKKDDPTEIGNYRSLSLLSGLSKILELSVADSIVSHVFNEELVTNNQRAYRKGRSTELFLAQLNKNWRRATERKQYTVINGVSSKSTAVTQCIPQGSILGPILFFLYTRDLRKVISAASTYMYADDTTICCVGETVDKVTAMMNRALGELNNSV